MIDDLSAQNPASCINRSDTNPRRPWVGLTEKEIKSLPSWWPSYEDAPALIKLVKDVEAKLKEKNMT